jgi:hypothetical protein
MAKTAKSISADKLATLTREAVRSVADAKGKFIGKGPIMGFVLQSGLSPAKQLDLASQITDSVTLTARQQGVGGLRPKPVVVTRPGQIIVGFIAPELQVKIR